MTSKENSFSYKSRNETLKQTSTSSKVQLWQFLLELLSDDTQSKIITWEGEYGEFRMNHPEEVAKLWGRRSNRRNMTYQTMSRALRHYYSKGVLSKVKHKKWCYRFSLQTLETARNITSLPATENVCSENVESYKSAVAYEEYINRVLFPLGMPLKPTPFPRNDFCIHHIDNMIKWPTFVNCFFGYSSPGLYNIYSLPVRSF